MKSVALDLTDEVVDGLARVAREENMPMEAFVAAILSEAVRHREALSHFKERAARADPDRVRAILDRVPDVPPEEGDELPDAAQIPDAVRRVEMAAMLKKLPIRVVRTEKTARTAQEAAAAVGTSVAQIVKSLVFRGAATGRPYLLLVSGANRVDETTVAGHLGEAIERPDAAFVREATGFAIGGVAPLGAAQPIATFMDETLLGFEAVWAAAGTPFHVFEVDPKALQAATGARTLSVS